MENTRSIIEKLNTYEINKGKIVKRDGKYYIVMERYLHTFPDKRVIEKYIKKPEDEVYDEFLMFIQSEDFYHETEWRVGKNNLWAISMKVPLKLIRDENNKYVGDPIFSIKYDEKLDIPYILLIRDDFHYKIYDFMEADYEIYDDKYPEGFTGGTQYCKKTGYTLKEFYEEYKKTRTV